MPRSEHDTVENPLWVVTGASGFLGNNVVRTLLSQGCRVRAAVLEEGVPAALAGLDVEVVRVDVRDRPSLDEAFSDPGPVWVVHCAGIVTIATNTTPLVEQVNVEGVRNVLDAAVATGVQRLTYVSSVHALPPVDGVSVEKDSPEDYDVNMVEGAYAKTKATATKMVLETTDLWKVVVLPSAMAGPNDFGDTHLTRLVADTASGNLLLTVEGAYDFADVRDVALGTVNATRFGTKGSTYILSGHRASAATITTAVARARRRFAPLKVPMSLAKLVAPAAEWISARRGTAPVVTPSSLDVLEEPGLFSSRRAAEELGYTVRPLQETIKDTLEWVETTRD